MRCDAACVLLRARNEPAELGEGDGTTSRNVARQVQFLRDYQWRGVLCTVSENVTGNVDDFPVDPPY